MTTLIALLLAAFAGDYLIVGNKAEHTVSIIDVVSGTTIKKLSTGMGPHEVAASADGKLAVVTNYGVQGAPGSSLSVIDLDKLEVSKTIELGHQRPHGIVFVGPRMVAVTSEVSRALLLVDIDKGAVQAAIGSESNGTHMVALAPNGQRAYTANIGSGSISEYDLANGQRLRTQTVSTQTEAIAVTPDSKAIWLGSNNADRVFVLRATDLAATDTIPVPGQPIRVAFALNGTRALVSSVRTSEVHVFDVAQRKLLYTVSVGAPVGIVISADGRTAYVASTTGNQIVAIDVATGKPGARFDTGTGPDGMAYVKR